PGTIIVTLTETGDDTGIFTGAATFTTAASSGTTLQVSEGDGITLTYAETTTFEGPAADRTDTATMATNGTAALDASSYALDDTATLTVTDPDLNTSAGSAQTVDVEVASDTDATGVDVTLTETGDDTGVFTGAATFTTAASSGTTLQVSEGDGITLTYAETTTFEGPAADRTDTASFPVNGSVAFDASSYALDDTATITVTDPDLNTAPGSAQTVDVQVASDTDITGVTVTLTETGDDTGTFAGSANFTTDASSGTTLQVAGGDALTLTYQETETFEGPAADRTDAATMTTNATAALDATTYQLDDTATLTVTDPDLNTSAGSPQSVEVNLASGTDTTGVTVTLTETGDDTGIFTGTATFATDASSGTTLQVDEGDGIMLTYTETTTFEGPSTGRTDVASFPHDGDVAFDAAVYSLADTATITATDLDLNTDPDSAQTMDVDLASDTDPTGVTVTLSETGNDTGVFTGAATFTTDPSSGTTLRIAQGDAITASYTDAAPFEEPAVHTASARAATNGTAALDAGRYALDETATITVTDPDLNTSADSAQTVEIEVASDTDPDTIFVTLTETGDDTGVFTGTATFTLDPSSDTMLEVSEGDGITLTYPEATTFEGPAADRTDTATMLADLATATFGEDSYRTSDRPAVTVTDDDANLDPDAIDTVNVTVTSETDTTGISVELEESGVDTGVFDEPDEVIDLVTSGSSNDATNVLRVGGGDTITATYSEPSFSGGIALRDDSATVELAGQTFEDVSPTHPFFNFIETLVAEGITAGCSTSPPKYCPSSSVTRGQMAVFLIRAMGEEGNLEPYEGTFSDVPITHSFALYIEHLARLEITGGCGGGKYCPSSSVTRGQMAVFLVKAFEL
ncbi:MAG TPA: S-layer homology domain-containing protein, partial [Actinomycetota bacterium]